MDQANDPDEKEALFEDLAEKIIVHTKLEELHFYPAVRERDTEELVVEALTEHAAIKRILSDLLDAEPTDPVFDAKIKELRHKIEQHVQEEESELFFRAQKLLGKNDLREIAREMAALQDEIENEEIGQDVSDELRDQPATR